jgi:hypothetical protein
VHDLALGKGFTFRSRGRLRLKGSTRRCTPSRSSGGRVDRDPHPDFGGSGTSCPAAEHGRLTAG